MTKFVIAMMPNHIQIRRPCIALEDSMSGQGDCSYAVTIDLSNCDFCAVIFD